MYTQLKTKRFSVSRRHRITKKWEKHEDQMKEYALHIGYGASGSWNSETKLGYISSHYKQCKKLEKLGYKNLKFNNGGDDDILVIDHINKEYGFFEDYVPSKEVMNECKNIMELWKRS